MKSRMIERYACAVVACGAVCMGFGASAATGIPACAYVQNGLIAQWDGIENAAPGRHQADATTWTDLTGGEAWTLGASGSFSDTALVCGGGGLAATRTTSLMGIQTMDIHVLQTETPGGLIFGSGQRVGGYSCYFGHASNGLTGGTPLVGYKVSTTLAVGVPQTTAVTYDLENGLYSTTVTAIYKDGASSQVVAYENYYGGYLDKATLGARYDGLMTFKGEIHALRLYSRKLTPSEIELNAALDRIRFEGADPETEGYRWNAGDRKLECRLSVECDPAQGGIAVDDTDVGASYGGWVVRETSHTIQAKPAAGYMFVRWNGDGLTDAERILPMLTLSANKALSLTAVFEPGVFTDGVPASAYVQDGLIAQWDGIENAGPGRHRTDATAWTDLTGGEAWALGASGSFSDTALVCAGGGLAATRTTSLTGIQTMDIHVLQTGKPGGLIFGSGQRTGGQSCYFGHPSNNTGTDTPLVGYKVSTTLAVGVPQTTTVAYDLESDLYSATVRAIYKDGATSSIVVYNDYYGGQLDKTTLGARNDNLVPFTGSIYALRLYSRKLTPSEIALNAAIDQVRFEGAAWPENCRWNAETKKVEYRVMLRALGDGTLTVGEEPGVMAVTNWLVAGESFAVYAVAVPSAGSRLAIWRGASVPGEQKTSNEIQFTVGGPADIDAKFIADDAAYWTFDEAGKTIVHNQSGLALKAERVAGGLALAGYVTTPGAGELDLRDPVYSPDLGEDLPLVAIKGSAFAGSADLSHVILPDTVTEIGAMAFCGCENLVEVRLSNALVTIGKQAFYGCLSLSDLSPRLPATVRTIGAEAFRDCQELSHVVVPEGVTEIPDLCFYNCLNLGDITIPESCTTIGSYVFTGDRVGTFTNVFPRFLPSGITSVGANAFVALSAKVLVMTLDNPGLTALGSAAFYGRRFGTVDLSRSSFGGFRNGLEFGDGVVDELILPPCCTNLCNPAYRGLGTVRKLRFTGNPPVVGSGTNVLDAVISAYYAPIADETWDRYLADHPEWVEPMTAADLTSWKKMLNDYFPDDSPRPRPRVKVKLNGIGDFRPLVRYGTRGLILLVR